MTRYYWFDNPAINKSALVLAGAWRAYKLASIGLPIALTAYQLVRKLRKK